jgi:hypothetical protein
VTASPDDQVPISHLHILHRTAEDHPHDIARSSGGPPGA